MNFKLVIGLAAIALAAGSSLYMNRSRIQNLHLKDHLTYVQWKNTQNKAYSSPKEEQFRKLNFYRNHRNIQTVNTDATLTYKAGLNQFSDLTEEEFVAKYTGFVGVDASNSVAHVNKGEINDDNVDWRTQGAVNAVKNQGQCGSCWAFSAVGAYESAWKIGGHQLLSFSEQQLVDCSGSYGNQGCNGGLMNNAFNYWIKGSKGVELEVTILTLAETELVSLTLPRSLEPSELSLSLPKTTVTDSSTPSPTNPSPLVLLPTPS